MVFGSRAHCQDITIIGLDSTAKKKRFMAWIWADLELSCLRERTTPIQISLDRFFL